jgi:predicted O-methyltransferase YrrM
MFTVINLLNFSIYSENRKYCGTRMLDKQNKVDLSTLHLSKTDDPEILFLLAKKSMERCDYKNAINYLTHLIKSSPDNINFSLALSLSLWYLGRISDSVARFNQTITLDERYRNSPEFKNILELKKELFTQIHVYLPDFFQGSQVPERQVFMSAAVDMIDTSETSIEILEIGAYAGSSMLTWSNAADKLLSGRCNITCIDPWGDSGADLFTEEMAEPLKSNLAYEAFCHNAALSPSNVQVTPIRGISRDILPKLIANKYDLIFIDGSHHYLDVLNDITESERLLRLGGIVCGDDLELQLKQCDQEFAKMNTQSDFIRDPRSGKDFHPGVTMAVGEFFGNVSCYSGFWAMRLTSNGYEGISFTEAKGLRLLNHWPPKSHEKIARYFETSNELGQLL